LSILHSPAPDPGAPAQKTGIIFRGRLPRRAEHTAVEPPVGAKERRRVRFSPHTLWKPCSEATAGSESMSCRGKKRFLLFDIAFAEICHGFRFTFT